MNNLRNSLKIENGRYTFGGMDLEKIVEANHTPFYIYDTGTILERYRELYSYIDYPVLHLFFALKSNNNPGILKVLLEAGCGLDAVSTAEVKLGLKLGFPREKIIFTANNISQEEMIEVHNTGVLMNIGSLSRLRKFCRAFPGGRVCLRFNPDIRAGEHVKIQTGGDSTKFGILLTDIPEAASICREYNTRVVGLHKHTGSGISDTDLYLKSMENLLSAAVYFRDLEFVDFGGGFKVPYREDEVPVDYSLFGRAITDLFTEFCKNYGRELALYFEPGKFLVAESGLLVLSVNTVKNNNGRLIAGTDSGFPHLIRPALYNAYHAVRNISNPDGAVAEYDICGNICESGDRFAEQRSVKEIREGDYLVICNAGGYCASMAGTYNLRPVPPELIIRDGHCLTARRGLSSDELVMRILEESNAY